ncbi:MAG: tetratricopeptide repeat protein [Candidatus Riflebacteria bacterium]|nr:tetratricopeptide repeat protein [Candidatus Riflebacteria bacterium]
MTSSPHCRTLTRLAGPVLLFLLLVVGGPSGAAPQDKSRPATPKEEAKSLIQEGLNCLILEQNKKAEEAFLKAKSIDPYSEEAHNFLGLLYLQEGLNQKAEEMLMRAIAIDPMYSEALRNLGKLYLQLERFPEAASYLRRTLAIDRGQPYTWYLLGMASYFTNQVEEAIKAYEEAFAQDPNLPAEAHYNLGVAYHETSRYFEAIHEYETVLKMEPEHINAMNNLGLVYSVLGEKERAVELFNRVLALEANNVKARINLGNVYLGTKELVEAERIYRSAISLDETDISPRLNLGVVFFEMGDLDKARQEWEALLAKDPGNLRVLSVMGSAFLEKKRFDDAIAVFKKMVELMPENGSIANTLGYLLADQNRELPLAKKLIDKALELDKPNRATYLDSLAWVHFRNGNFEQARQVQEKAMKIFRLSHEAISSEVHLHLGRIYEKLDRQAEAIKAYEEAVRSNTDAEIVALASESLGILTPKK